MTPRTFPPAGRIPELDGLRGLAILLVLLLHYIGEIAVPKAEWQSKALHLLMLSWSGVDLFFVLSGFLIGGILLDAKLADHYYRTFYLRRLYRIAPLYAILTASFVIGLYFVGPGAAKPLRELFNHRIPIWSYPLFLQNVFMPLCHSWGSGWMAVTWSLAVEEQFYLLLPLAVRHLSHRGIVGFAIAMIAVAPVLRTFLERHGVDGLAIYTLLPCRSDALGLGLLVAIACRNQTAWTWLASHRRYVYAAFGVLGFGLLVWILQDLWLGYTWVAAFYTSLLVLVLVTPGRIERLVFRGVVLSRLGTVAYSVYLFHTGILRLYHYTFFGALPSIHDLPTFCVTLISLGTVLLLSAISWRVLEQPLLQRARFRYRYGNT